MTQQNPEFQSYVGKFSARYKKEDSFRDIVHGYLKLGGMKKFGLSVGKVVRPSWYRKRTQQMIEEYVSKIYEDIRRAQEIKQTLLDMQKRENDIFQKQEEIKKTETSREEIEQQYHQTIAEKENKVDEMKQKEKEEKSSLETKIQEQEQVIQQRTNPEELARKKLLEYVVKSPLLKTNEAGELQFDEKQIVAKLEDIFLKEIVEGIEKDSGTGFMSKVKAEYEGLIDYWDELEDLNELPEVDWVQSAIESRIHGYRAPQFPYFIVGKAGKIPVRGKISLDTAISVDSSGSMVYDNRFVIAKKTALATEALMRKLNPKNNTFLSHFNDYLYDISPVELIRKQEVSGSTSTYLSLNWLLDRLKGQGVGLAYLATDGLPEGYDAIERAIEAAKKFQQYPHILLRIFLIDGNPDTESIIRRIGKAAGRSTKVISVKNYQLGGGLIKDVSQAFGEMRAIDEF